MADAGKTSTEKKINKLDKQLQEVYSEAYKDITGKLNEFTHKFLAKEEIYQQKLDDGEITQEQYESWYKGQVFQGKMWRTKQQQIAETMTDTNKIAMNIINGGKIDVFTENANWTAYELEHDEGLNFGFGLYDATTVTKLIKENPQMLPEWKIDEPKDYIWNEKKVNRCITQSIIQGESLDKTTKRLTDALVTQNENHMKMFARTAMTGAQNAGRDQRLIEAKSKGITVVKQWMATLDKHTRDSHAEIDGETIKVGDKWHPMKFSNGCRYPGDPDGPPQEVYNCRCTLVGDVEDYPAEYERYDNVDGVPIKNMSYEEWKIMKVEQAAEQEKQAVYTKFGGEENYKILSKYENYDDFLNNSSTEEFDQVWNYYGEVSKIMKVYEEGIPEILSEEDKTKLEAEKQYKKELKQYEKDVEKYEKDLESLKKEYEEVKAEADAAGADKVFSGIWYGKDVTYADWEEKKDSIESKKEYYNDQIDKYKQKFSEDITGDPTIGNDLYNAFTVIGNKEEAWEDEFVQQLFEDFDLDHSDLDDVWTIFEDTHTKVEKMEDKLTLLAEFEKNGESMSKLLAEQADALQAIKDYEKLKPIMPIDPNAPMIGSFPASAYTDERKDNALWALRSKDADDALREKCGEVWKDAPKIEKDAIYEYTSSYHKFNEPLRGIEYGSEEYKGVGNTNLDARGNGVYLNAMTDIIDKSSYEHDMWLQRGCGFKGMDKFFNCDPDLLRNGTQEELEAALLGTTPTEYGFMSCGSSKGQGFSGNIMLNIYAPAGTKMMYVEPFSAFGDGDGRRWDGESKQRTFGGELETILQQGTQFRVTKIEKVGSKIYFDLEVIDQSHQQRWEP